ncbi:hypothetical protein [Crossiella equi]|uniref:hypothetical protein n=1 Tax=Crossiella equi TaxID=130796 RepID=UPI00117768AF|nr:hypothetical protein [Crossiella equi]
MHAPGYWLSVLFGPLLRAPLSSAVAVCGASAAIAGAALAKKEQQPYSAGGGGAAVTADWCPQRQRRMAPGGRVRRGHGCHRGRRPGAAAVRLSDRGAG